IDALCAVDPTALPCVVASTDGGVDAGTDAGVDAGVDAPADVAMDVPTDAGTDARADVSVRDVQLLDARPLADVTSDSPREAGRRSDGGDGGDASFVPLVGLHGGCMCRAAGATPARRGGLRDLAAAFTLVAVALARTRRRRG
ncbi:MAG: hypothetical protein WCJ30_13125, partial [Deltaproteobacteria bacterium]